MLLAAGADPDARDDVMHATPRAFGICVPASWGHMTFLKRRLREDSSAANLLEGRGTPLHEAARSGHIGIAKNVCEKPQSDNLAAWKGIHTPVTSRMNNGH